MSNTISQTDQTARTSAETSTIRERSNGLSIVAKILLTLIIIAHPLFYFSMFAGDAEIHLVYGMNSAQGNYFEYNVGEKSAGVTSPGYMLFIAAFFKTLPDSVVPLAVKLTNLLFWYLLVILTFRLVREFEAGSFWSWTMATLVALMPGTVYNATLGMENGIFGALFVFWFLVAIRWKWFHQWGESTGKELLIGLLLGALLWIRPEGFVLAAIAFSFRLPLLIRSLRSSSGAIFHPIIRMLYSALPVIILSALYFYFHYSQTGHLLPQSGVSRVIMGAQNSIQIGGLALNTKFVRFFIFYFPLTIAMVAGLRATLTNREANEVNTINHYFLVATLAIFFVLYSSILSAHHFSRYTIFLMPVIVVYAGVGARWISARLLTGRFGLARNSVLLIGSVSVTILCILFASEIYLRQQSGSNYPFGNLWKAMDAPENRKDFSDKLYASLGKPGQLPISLAYVEVQIRYHLD
ncbi:MAG: hypothetical protein IIB00_10690, partial [candidate division Zixibacteria bacterium]|nr:hypothetical protein [candidate division Zixibacteria bacterium]